MDENHNIKTPILVKLESDYISLEAKVKSGKHDYQLQLADTCKEMAEIHFRQNDYLISSELYSKALTIYTQLKNNTGLITCQNAKASICLAKGELAAAQSKLEGLLHMFKKHPNPELEHVVLNNMGIVHEKKGDLSQAVLYYHHSLSIKYELGNPLLPTYTLHNLANIFQQVKDYDSAIKYNQIALEIIDNGIDLNAQATIRNSIAHIVLLQGHLVEAREKFQQAKEIAIKGNNLAQVAQSRVGLGKIEFKRKNFSEAKDLLEKSLEAYRKLEEQEYIVRCLIDLSKINQTLNFNIALHQVQEACRICKINGFKSLLAEVYQHLSKLKETKLDYKKAFYYQKLYHEIYKETHKTNILNQIEVNKLSLELKKSKTLSENLKQQAKQLEHESLHDHLTGVGNRRQLDRYLNTKWIKKTDQEGINYLAMLDIDDFKYINDTYSHDLGDKVLQSISAIISSCINKNDEIFRYGGEEFVILIANSKKQKAIDTFNTIRHSIESYDWQQLHLSLAVTVTLGMVSNTEHPNIESALKLADERMYIGKSSGKNQLVSE